MHLRPGVPPVELRCEGTDAGGCASDRIYGYNWGDSLGAPPAPTGFSPSIRPFAARGVHAQICVVEDPRAGPRRERGSGIILGYFATSHLGQRFSKTLGIDFTEKLGGGATRPGHPGWAVHRTPSRGRADAVSAGCAAPLTDAPASVEDFRCELRLPIESRHSDLFWKWRTA